MFVSVIIPTLNRSRLLNRTLFTLFEQITDNDFEIIVVDNGSSDNTREIVEKYIGIRKNNLVYVYDDRPGLLVGRHIGAQNAKGDILTFIDDDVILPPCWIQGIYDVFSNESISLATGNNYPFYECDVPEWIGKMWSSHGDKGRYLYQLSLLDLRDGSFTIEPVFVWGLNYHIRKNVFCDVGGFNPDILPKDYIHFIGDGETGISDTIKQKNYKAFFDSRLSLYHTVTSERLSKDYFLRRSHTEGMMNAYTEMRSKNHFGNTAKTPGISKKQLESIANIVWHIRHAGIYLKDSEHFKFKKDIYRSIKKGYEDYKRHFESNKSIMQQYVNENNYLDIDAIAAKYFTKHK